MRWLSLLILAMVAAALLPGAAEGLCPKLRYVDNVEWLGVGDFGMDLGMPEQKRPEQKIAGTEEDGTANLEETGPMDGTDENVTDAGETEEEVEGAALGEGRLDLVLTGGVTGRVDLSLIRSGDVVFGSGNLTIAGSKSGVGACGTASDEGLILKLVPQDGSRLYLLDLKGGLGSVRGSYEMMGSDGGLISGRVDRSPFS
ncbi:hypothetical protein P0O24_07715 [Methanotrichaceae archaeon M04Ac]|uniref:Auto-transporter adhesin head GIN domain-containing protein n=1 Tax=Candidatus Methanocrinis alkalitolerans TaxID=3033395 RepID=A0ABT5XFH2_9EURY|nr:hypothetical protein [Candidatus Methanocrinis alkalitolerans]MCR3883085.1 hypothetical protein [Methanothrix sp.]MDF0593467.1 hypothetical protein [Candidatus Methanocrinis alkalitolerans]